MLTQFVYVSNVNAIFHMRSDKQHRKTFFLYENFRVLYNICLHTISLTPIEYSMYSKKTFPLQLLFLLVLLLLFFLTLFLFSLKNAYVLALDIGFSLNFSFSMYEQQQCMHKFFFV